MKRDLFLLVFVLISLFSSCRYRTAPDQVGVSKAVASGQISLGGIIAEQLVEEHPENHNNETREHNLAQATNKLIIKTEELKNRNRTIKTENLIRDWETLQETITDRFEQLTAEDIRLWVAWNDSLLKYTGQVWFADELERMFYNAPIPDVITEEQVKSVCYTRLYDRIYVNIYGSSAIEYEHTTGGKIRMIQDTKYPYDGSIRLRFEMQDTRYLDLFIRIPEWADRASVTVKGVKYNVIAGQFTEVAKKWKNGDEVEIILGMRPNVIRSMGNKLAFTYGPLFLTYVKPFHELPVFPESDPIRHLQFVSPPGTIPTFTFSGIPREALALQPYFAERDSAEVRTAWIKTAD
ncbi:hypothetical protein [Gaoshiqia sp. Z1-71]|uniref:hypothetical protein n=1 Tax=Gaoshiqia hydrogeniformans TaxID=3290090 RepID=UPI003BF7F3A7